MRRFHRAILVLATLCTAVRADAQTIEFTTLGEDPLHLALVDTDADGAREITIATATVLAVVRDEPAGLTPVVSMPHGVATVSDLVATENSCAYAVIAGGAAGIVTTKLDGANASAVECFDPALVGVASLAAGIALDDRTAIVGGGVFSEPGLMVSTRLVAGDCSSGDPDDGCGGALPGLDSLTDFFEEPIDLLLTDVDDDGARDIAALFVDSQCVRFARTIAQESFSGLEVALVTDLAVTCTAQTPTILCSGPTELTVHEDPLVLVAADLDGDGDEDLAALCAEGGGTFSIFEKLGAKAYRGRFGVPVGGGVVHCAVLDVDGDGDLDLAAASATEVWTIAQLSPLVYGVPTLVHATSGMITAIEAGDVDGDGARELVVAEAGPARLAVITFPTGAGFIRGDADQDGAVTIADPIHTLLHLFAATPPVLACADAADVLEDEQLDIADPIASLLFQFAAGPLPPAPYPACGADPAGSEIDCAVGGCP